MEETQKTIYVPSRDHVQQEVLNNFVALLQRIKDNNIAEFVNGFLADYDGILAWLGKARQNEIIKEAQRLTQIDLSFWLN